MHRIWTDGEDKIVASLYSNVSTKQIAAQLDRSIELFGNYWHKAEEAEERKKIFAEYGFETLIIWENELKNEEAIIEKVKQFTTQSGLSATILKFFRV